MSKRFKVGCLAVILYCVGCCLYVGISGQGFFWVFGVFGTIKGGHRISALEEFVLRGIDVVTAPVQVPLWGLLYVKHVTGESGRIERELKRQEAAYERYMKLLDENFDRIYTESEFLNPTNTPAIKAVGCWTSYCHNRECGKFSDERLRRFAEYQLGHQELMLTFREFWRRADLPVDLQKRALAATLKMAEENPSEDVKWLLWGVMGVGDGDKEQWTIPDDALRGYATNRVEIIRWSAQETLKGRASYRDHLRRREEHLRKMREGTGKETR